MTPNDPKRADRIAGRARARAAQIIFEEKVGCVPVVAHHKLVGIITEADFVRMAIRELSDPGR